MALFKKTRSYFCHAKAIQVAILVIFHLQHARVFFAGYTFRLHVILNWGWIFPLHAGVLNKHVFFNVVKQLELMNISNSKYVCLPFLTMVDSHSALTTKTLFQSVHIVKVYGCLPARPLWSALFSLMPSPPDQIFF